MGVRKHFRVSERMASELSRLARELGVTESWFVEACFWRAKDAVASELRRKRGKSGAGRDAGVGSGDDVIARAVRDVSSVSDLLWEAVDAVPQYGTEH